MTTPTPRTDELKKALWQLMQSQESEKVYAWRDAIHFGIEQLERDLAAAKEARQAAEALAAQNAKNAAEAILILCAQFDTSGEDGIDAWLAELSMPDCEGRFDKIVNDTRAAIAEEKP